MKRKFVFSSQKEIKKVLKRIVRPGYRRVNIDLLPDALLKQIKLNIISALYLSLSR